MFQTSIGKRAQKKLEEWSIRRGPVLSSRRLQIPTRIVLGFAYTPRRFRSYASFVYMAA